MEGVCCSAQSQAKPSRSPATVPGVGLSPSTTAPCRTPVLAPSPELSGGHRGKFTHGHVQGPASPSLTPERHNANKTTKAELQIQEKQERTTQTWGKKASGGRATSPSPAALPPPVPPCLSLSAAQAPSPAPLPSSQTHGLRAGSPPGTGCSLQRLLRSSQTGVKSSCSAQPERHCHGHT